jgi:SAM-dependent methyltransferase
MSSAPDPDRLKAFSFQVFNALQGAMTSAMIHLGDKLGLYRALADADAALTSTELAERTELNERWVREWLHAQGAAGVLDYAGDDRFLLSPEARVVLADEDHPAFGCGMFSSLPQTISVLDKLPEAFRTGVGLGYDAFGPEGARGVERGFAPWYRSLLVPMALPRVEGLVPALESGIAVADVGCGGGVALVEMAQAFPKSEFEGYDISLHALERAKQNAKEAGAGNVTFHDAANDPLPQDARFGFVTTFDCLHDMTHPEEVISQIRGSIAEGGGRDDVRHLGDELHVVGAVGARRQGPGNARPARRSCARVRRRSGLHPLRNARPRSPGQRLLRRAPLAASCARTAAGRGPGRCGSWGVEPRPRACPRPRSHRPSRRLRGRDRSRGRRS